MRRLGADMLLGRIGGAAFGRPMLGGVLGRVFSAPSVVRAAVVVPLISKLEPHGSGVHQHRFTFGIRLGLGLAAGAAILVGQSEDAKCMPKRKGKATVPDEKCNWKKSLQLAQLASCQLRWPQRIRCHKCKCCMPWMLRHEALPRKAALRRASTKLSSRIQPTAAAAYASQQRTSVAAVYAMKTLARSPRRCGLI